MQDEKALPRPPGGSVRNGAIAYDMPDRPEGIADRERASIPTGSMDVNGTDSSPDRPIEEERSEEVAVTPDLARLHNAFRVQILEPQIELVLNGALEGEARILAAEFLLTEIIAAELERNGLGFSTTEAEQRGIKVTFAKDGRVYNFEPSAFPRWERLGELKSRWDEASSEVLFLEIAEAASKHSLSIETGSWREGL